MINKDTIKALIENGVLLRWANGEQLQFTAYSKRPRSLDSSEYITGIAYTKGSGYTSSTAWEIGDIVVIEDIKKELEKPRQDRKYQTTDQHDPPTENGCIISFPIFDKELKDNFPDGLICVINIISKKPFIFLEKKKDYYNKLLESLSYRILLENRLALLKSLLPKALTASLAVTIDSLKAFPPYSLSFFALSFQSLIVFAQVT